LLIAVEYYLFLNYILLKVAQNKLVRDKSYSYIMKLKDTQKHILFLLAIGCVTTFAMVLIEYLLIRFVFDNQLVINEKYDVCSYSLYIITAFFVALIFACFGYVIYKLSKRNSFLDYSLFFRDKGFREIFEESPFGIAIVDSDTGIINDANMKYLEIAGFTKEDIGKKSCFSKLNAEDLEQFLAYKKQLVASNQKSLKLTQRYQGNDGKLVWVNASVSILDSKSKKKGQCILTIEDISANKYTEDALITSENELKKMFSVMREVIFVLDSNGKYVKIAPTNPSLLYKSADILLGKSIADFFSEEKTAFFINQIQLCLNQDKTFHIEYDMEIDGKRIFFEGSVTPLTSDSALWVARDITEIRKIQEELKVKEKNTMLFNFSAQLPGAMYQFRYFPDGHFVFPFVSEGAEELSGLTLDEIKNDAMKAFNLVHEEDFPILIQSIENSMANIGDWALEFKINHPKKGVRWIRGNSKSERLADNSVLWHGYFADITNSKFAEEALRISKDKLEAVFNGSNDAIMLLTRKGFFDCNPKTLKMFGLADRKEFINIHPSDLSPPIQPDGQNSLVKANQMIEIAFEKGSNRFEWIHQRKNGEIFPAEILLSAFNYGNEKVLQATVHDITERKKAERKIRENEALLTGILQTLPVAVFAKHIKNNFSFSLWNKKAEEIFGISASECIGKTDYDLFPVKDADWYRKNDIDATIKDEIIDIAEEVVESGSGKKVIVHTRKIVVKDLKGEPYLLLGVSEDITEQKESEEKIRKSEEKYRSVVENAVDIIIIINEKHEIQFVNHVREGYNQNSVMGTSIYKFMPDEYESLVRLKVKNVFETKQAQHYETKGKNTNGDYSWYSVNAGPIFSGEDVIGVTLIIRDITESKEAEEKTKNSLKEKEVLLKEVHHRVKNNLQIILSILNLQYSNVSDKKILNLLRDIRSRIKAMSFVHELLYQANDFSKINFSEYIGSISTNLVYSYSQEKEIGLKLDVGNVFLDLDRAIPCGLIINELLTNALKYAFVSKDEGEVRIVLKQNGNEICLIVSDNGVGFPSTIDFRNTESLGMQLVVTLVQQLRGEIVLDNSSGAHYTITFNTPS
jgi:PAS domain S-box-containing protein